MNDYGAYLFDFDGTLARTLDLHLSIRRRVLEAHGLHPSDEELAASLGKLDQALADWGLDVKAVGGEMDKLVEQRLPDVDLYPGAADMLKRLKDSGKKTALITASFHAWITDTVDRHGLHGYFDVIIGADDIEHLKPHPEGLLSAMEKLGVQPDGALMLGDSDKDLLAAQNAGIDSLLFYPPSHRLIYRLDDLRQLRPTYVIDDWSVL